MKNISKLLVAAIFVCVPSVVLADLSLPHFFSDHMVIQRDRDVAIWGKASPDALVTVSFKEAKTSAKADGQGNWRALIASGVADAKGSVLTVTSGGQQVAISDVLVGEVWLASGQSNMYFTMNRVAEYAPLLAKAEYPGLRMFNTPLVTSVEPQNDIEGEWTLCSPSTAPNYSAVAFFFALKLHQELGIPVGVIKTAWGGKPVETFTSREALRKLPGTKLLVDAAMKSDSDYDQARAKAQYEKTLANWEAMAAAERKNPAPNRKKLAKRPTPPKRPLDTEGQPGVLFNSMIHPFVGYTMRGAIWYQGEGNAKAGAVPYDQTLPLMIRDWRQRWEDEFSFYYVQLANYRTPSTAPGTPDPWALLQDRMRLVLDTTPKTGMAIINDVGDAADIHPQDKKAPGERLARWALAKDYGQDLVYSGPLFRSSEIRDNAIRVTFDQSGSGLKSRDGGPLNRFEIAAADRVWHWADAKTDGKDSVLVSSPDVKQPVAVRYAWASNPEGANLINSEGLPASVFRTDSWDDVETTLTANSPSPNQARRAVAIEIKALNTKIAELDRTSDEAKELRTKVKALLDQVRELAPAK